MTESSLSERLGGAFAIAAVIDHFSDAVVRRENLLYMIRGSLLLEHESAVRVIATL
jgi:hypothetical protein